MFVVTSSVLIFLLHILIGCLVLSDSYYIYMHVNPIRAAGNREMVYHTTMGVLKISGAKKLVKKVFTQIISTSFEVANLTLSRSRLKTLCNGV